MPKAYGNWKAGVLLPWAAKLFWLIMHGNQANLEKGRVPLILPSPCPPVDQCLN